MEDTEFNCSLGRRVMSRRETNVFSLQKDVQSLTNLLTGRDTAVILSDPVPEWRIWLPGQMVQDLLFNLIEVFHHLSAKAVFCSDEDFYHLV